MIISMRPCAKALALVNLLALSSVFTPQSPKDLPQNNKWQLWQFASAQETFLPVNKNGMGLHLKNNVEYSSQEVDFVESVFRSKRESTDALIDTSVEAIINWLELNSTLEGSHLNSTKKLVFFQRHGQSQANVWEFYAFRSFKSGQEYTKQFPNVDPELSTEGVAQCKRQSKRWKEIFMRVKHKLLQREAETGKKINFCIDIFAVSGLTRCLQTEGLTFGDLIDDFACQYNSSSLSSSSSLSNPGFLIVPYLREHQDSRGEIGRPWPVLEAAIRDMQKRNCMPESFKYDSSLIQDGHKWWLPCTKEEVLEYARLLKSLQQTSSSLQERFPGLDTTCKNPTEIFAQALKVAFPSHKRNYRAEREAQFQRLEKIKPSFAPVPREHPHLLSMRARAVFDSFCAVPTARIAIFGSHKNILSHIVGSKVAFKNAEVRIYQIDCETKEIAPLVDYK